MVATPIVTTLGDIHEDLERIYTVITTPEERVVMKPFKSLFDEINTALVGHHLDPENSAFRNLCLSWCRRAHEGTRLLPRHLVIDCGCVVLRVWFRWVLRYCSDQVVLHCRRIVEAFKERNDTCRALLECDEVVDVVTLSHDEVIQCVVDDAHALYPLYLCGDEQPFHILRGALGDVGEIHAFLDLFWRIGENLSHHLGVHRADMKTIMSNALADLVTRAWIRRWVLLLVGAIHIHSPITAWMNHEDSLFQQWGPARLVCIVSFEIAFRALVKLTQLIFDDETRMAFVVMVAMVVLKEQMVRHVFPLGEWAVQTSSIADKKEEGGSEVVEVDGDGAGISDTENTSTRAYQFLFELNDHVLMKLSFMSEWLRGGTEIQKGRHESTTAEDLFLVLIFSFFTNSPITSFDDPELRHTFLFRLLELAALRRLERCLRGDRDGTVATLVEDDDWIAEDAFFEQVFRERFSRRRTDVSRARETHSPGENKSDAEKDSSTSADSDQDEKTSTDAHPNCEERERDVHLLNMLFEFRQRIFIANIRSYSHWHRLSLNAQPYDVLRLVQCTMDVLIVRCVETMLMGTYSTSTLVSSMDHHHGSVENSQLNVSGKSQEEQREDRILSLINAATGIAWKLNKWVDYSSDWHYSLLYFGMKNILANLPPDELDMYLCSIMDAIHNYFLKFGGYFNWTSDDIAGVLERLSTDVKPYVTIAQWYHMDMVRSADVNERSTAVNTKDETDAVIQQRIEHGHAYIRLQVDLENMFLVGNMVRHPNPEQVPDYSSSIHRFIRIVSTMHLQLLSALPIPFDQTGVFLRYMDASLRVRLLFRPQITILDHSTTTPSICLHDKTSLPPIDVRILDERHWGYHPSTYFFMAQIAASASSSTRTTSTPPTQLPSDSEELPFPADLAVALVDYTHEYQQEQHHEQRQLHWCRDYAYTTFVMYYPRDGGLPTTIHGTLLLQRLFVALAGYKRVGVTWSRLAARARMSVEDLKEQLHKCVELGLLVCVGKDDKSEEGHGVEYVAMNYDYVRPVESTDGVIVLWPEPLRHVRDMVADRRTITDAQRVEQLAPVVMSIMKERKRIRYSELFHLVCGAEHTIVVPTWAMFKACVEGLIDRHYLSRTVEDNELPSLSPLIMLEYVP